MTLFGEINAHDTLYGPKGEVLIQDPKITQMMECAMIGSHFTTTSHHASLDEPFKESSMERMMKYFRVSMFKETITPTPSRLILK